MQTSNRSFLHALRVPAAELIYRGLAERQHVNPHASLADVLGEARASDICPAAADSAIAWLGVDATRKIGRFSRTELSQLAAAIERFWAKNLAD